MSPEKFNVRVYGLLREENQILVTDEVRGGNSMTKFPGGGLEFGEGIQECLIREFEEELDIKIEVKNLFYINDFFQTSAFNAKEQLISIYYFVENVSKKQIPVVKKPFSFPPQINQCFRWLQIEKLRQMDFTYPIDQQVAIMLKSGK